ncbi:hypothetical protein Strop_2002 [Salinispora tropica CNB-440]|uniref:Uncharacterized protein n=1 Tax=Salinispora tropica (strain ATCC BAA-916 / DSM 44818 / JCM 13857 / NBRC 105044 / CNB-440) TaxID=369723 RepID=A4X6F6_SALTO|nr:hypothetical protein Strop_2002 [Salinispora tropica CNB-440]
MHTLDLAALPEQQRRFLHGVGRRLRGKVLQRREPGRRYRILLTLLVSIRTAIPAMTQSEPRKPSLPPVRQVLTRYRFEAY